MYQLRITKSFKIDYKKLSKSEAEDTDITCIRISSHTNIFDTKKRQK